MAADGSGQLGPADVLDWHRQTIEALEDGIERASALPERLETMESVEVGETPAEVVYEENKLELLHYDAEAAGIDVPEDERESIPILIVYALINRPYILDLQPDRSVVRRLLEAGHDVYLIKWNEPSRLDQHLTLDDYVNRYVDNCVDVVRERSGADAIDLLGYCMGGTMSAMYTALHPEKVNALGLMAAGLCFDGTGGVLEQWGAGEHYDPEAVTDAFGNVPAEFLDVGFALMDPIDNYVSKYVRLAENVDNEEFVENFARMEQWLSEGVDVAGEAYVEFLEKIYQNDELVRGELEIGGERVDLDEIDHPVLQLMGEYDHLVPPTASKPFNDAVASDDVTTIEYPTGHIGLSVSSSSHEDVWPEAAQWFKDRRMDVSDPDVVERAAQAVADADEGDEDGSAGEGADAVAESDADSAASGDVADAPEDVTEPDEGDVADGESDTTGEAAAQEERDDARTGADAESTVDTDDSADDTNEPADATPAAEAPTVDDPAELETVGGIGPTYADRLRDAGIEDTADLAERDVSDLAEIAQTSETRVREWLDQL